MTGTAAEVTPVGSIDDVDIGVGPVTRALQAAYLATVSGTDGRWNSWRDVFERRPVDVATR